MKFNGILWDLNGISWDFHGSFMDFVFFLNFTINNRDKMTLLGIYDMMVLDHVRNLFFVSTALLCD